MADLKTQINELIKGLIEDGLWRPRRVGSMTRKEAEAFLERNPKIKKILLAKGTLWNKLDSAWLFGDASNEADANQDLIEVARAMGWIEESD